MAEYRNRRDDEGGAGATKPAAITYARPSISALVLGETRAMIGERLRNRVSTVDALHAVHAVGTGKMLRTRLAAHLLDEHAGDELVGRVVCACAATEVVHSASLLHDDVIDGGSVRRGRPALWRDIGANGAVLLGDVLFCEALSLIGETKVPAYMHLFVEKVREVCVSEVSQELSLRGRVVDAERCLAVARGKTGPLFSFSALVCAGGDAAKSEAFEEVGYQIGTAYQLMDDLLDERGSEASAGKTLGTDRLRRKFTLAHGVSDPERGIGPHVERLVDSAIRRLEPWPAVQARLREYLAGGFDSVTSPEPSL